MDVGGKFVQVALGLAPGIVGLRVGQVVRNAKVEIGQFIRVGVLGVQRLLERLPAFFISADKCNLTHTTG